MYVTGKIMKGEEHNYGYYHSLQRGFYYFTWLQL